MQGINTVTGFKIFDKGPRTLYHGVKGSRRLPTQQWIEAEVKDGDDNGPVYRTGFHFFTDRAAAEEYLHRRFRRPAEKVILPIRAAEVWPKARSPHSVMLARFMFIEA